MEHAMNQVGCPILIYCYKLMNMARLIHLVD